MIDPKINFKIFFFFSFLIYPFKSNYFEHSPNLFILYFEKYLRNYFQIFSFSFFQDYLNFKKTYLNLFFKYFRFEKNSKGLNLIFSFSFFLNFQIIKFYLIPIEWLHHSESGSKLPFLIFSFSFFLKFNYSKYLIFIINQFDMSALLKYNFINFCLILIYFKLINLMIDHFLYLDLKINPFNYFPTFFSFFFLISIPNFIIITINFTIYHLNFIKFLIIYN